MVINAKQTLTEEEMDIFLVRQKDKIIRLIDDGKIDQARAALSVVRELWQVLGYDYKRSELLARMLVWISRNS